MKVRLLLVFLSLCFSCAAPGTERVTEEGEYSVTIGTASVRGVYHPTGLAICKLMSEKQGSHGIRCSVKSTSGSIRNINSVLAGSMEFGIAQSDRQYQAWYGLGEWKAKGPQKELRAVFSIHPEMLILLAADDSGIRTIQDLSGRMVNVGNPRYGHDRLSIDALNNAGIDYKTDIKTVNGSLQDRRVDAVFTITGKHPSKTVREITSGGRNVHFVPITGIERLLKKYPYYAKAYIPMKYYPAATNVNDVETFGVKATLVTSIKVPDYVVYTITKEVFDNFEAFKMLHPAGELLTKRNMLEGISAPFHPGASTYFREIGLE